MRLARRSLLSLPLFCFSALSNAQFAHLQLQSDAGDFIGQGQTWDVTYTPIDSIFFNANGNDAVGGAPSRVGFIFMKSDQSNDFLASLDFATADEATPLTVGTTYADAQRWPFEGAGHPGMDVSFQHRGSNTLTGEFTVDKLTYTVDPSNSNHFFVDSFIVSFTQHSEGGTPALHGTFEYEAVPEPASIAFLSLGVLGLMRRRKKTAAS
jgi:hypothetical protein